MKRKKIAAAVLSLSLLFAPLTAYAKNGPNLEASSLESYITLLDNSGNPTDLFYSSGGTKSEASTVDGAKYDLSSNTLYLSGLTTDQKLECSMMGDDFKIQLSGTNSIGQITIWGDGYGGSVTIGGNGKLSVNSKLSYTDVPAILLRADGAAARFTLADTALVTLKGTSATGSLAIMSTSVAGSTAAIQAGLDKSKITTAANSDSTYDHQLTDASVTLQLQSAKTSATKSTATTLKKTKITSVTAKKNALTVKWKKVSGASYYQVQFSTNASFKNAATKKTTANSVKLTKLKSGKKYYIRIRSCTTANGTRVTSAWSAKKSAKAK